MSSPHQSLPHSFIHRKPPRLPQPLAASMCDVELCVDQDRANTSALGYLAGHWVYIRWQRSWFSFLEHRERARPSFESALFLETGLFLILLCLCTGDSHGQRHYVFLVIFQVISSLRPEMWTISLERLERISISSAQNIHSHLKMILLHFGGQGSRSLLPHNRDETVSYCIIGKLVVAPPPHT